MAPGTLARAVAVAKLVALGALTPLLAPAMALVAARNRRRLAPVIDDLAGALAALDTGEPGPLSDHRVARLPAAGRYAIASDLHRGPRDVVDLPRRQRTADLYRAAVDHYARDGWTLVENGDVEDLWLVGGSPYGVGYEVRLLAARLVRPLVGRGPELAVLAHHLDRIVADDADLYARLAALAADGRYVRVAGNHDDLFQHEAGVQALRRHLPNVSVHDHVLLVHDGTTVGVVTHGHHTDAWNAPGADGLGKLCTSWACAVYDAPWLDAWPGIAPPVATERLLGGEVTSTLSTVDARFGANLDLVTTDEVRLFESFERRWPGGLGAPWLLLGHTHLPRAGGRTPDGRRWRRYVNGGSGVSHDLVTLIEWDGDRDPSEPDVRLVAWTPGTDGPDRRELAVDERGVLAPRTAAGAGVA